MSNQQPHEYLTKECITDEALEDNANLVDDN